MDAQIVFMANCKTTTTKDFIFLALLPSEKARLAKARHRYSRAHRCMMIIWHVPPEFHTPEESIQRGYDVRYLMIVKKHKFRRYGDECPDMEEEHFGVAEEDSSLLIGIILARREINKPVLDERFHNSNEELLLRMRVILTQTGNHQPMRDENFLRLQNAWPLISHHL